MPRPALVLVANYGRDDDDDNDNDNSLLPTGRIQAW